MMAQSRTSAYPRPMGELVSHAKQLARELGRIPSQNRLKAALHVRAERAKAVLQELDESGFDPTAPDPDTVREPVGAGPVWPRRGTVAEPHRTRPAHGRSRPGSRRASGVALAGDPAGRTRVRGDLVRLGRSGGVGRVRSRPPAPGIADGFTINSAITLPIGMETYAAYALRVWLSDGRPARARRSPSAAPSRHSYSARSVRSPTT